MEASSMADHISSVNTPLNSMSPYFLHNSDNPGTVLVSRILTGDNFFTWSRAMQMALSAKNKLGFIDGTIPKPDSDMNPDDFALWQRCNDMVLSWILNSIDAELANSVIYTDSASEVWADLIEHFSQSNAPRLYQIRRAISSLTQDQSSVAAYFNKLKGYWDELASYSPMPSCTCGAMKTLHDRDQEEKVLQFLMGLHDSYTTVRG
jgi:hypothetical protein